MRCQSSNNSFRKATFLAPALSGIQVSTSRRAALPVKMVFRTMANAASSSLSQCLRVRKKIERSGTSLLANGRVRTLQKEWDEPRSSSLVHRSRSESEGYRAFGRLGGVSKFSSNCTEVIDRPPGCCGMVNTGNTCYQNSILQCLNAVPEFVDFIATDKWKEEAKVGPAMVELFVDIWTGEYGDVVSPRNLQRAIGAGSWSASVGTQQDAHEFLMSLFNVLRDESFRRSSPPKYREIPTHPDPSVQATEEWNYAREWNDSPLDDIFGLQLHTTTTCQRCSNVSHRFGYATELQVDLPEASSSGAVNLSECVRSFVKREVLEEYKCEKCDAMVEAEQRTTVYRQPKVLVVSLKRFKTDWDGVGLRTSKVSVPVDIDQTQIDLSGICDEHIVRECSGEGCTYDLLATANHFGTLEFGHYTTVARSFVDNVFREFDDRRLSVLPDPKTDLQNAYVLFFRCRENRL